MSDRNHDTELETLFAATRSAAPVPSGALLARVLDDAAAVQRAGAATRPPATRRARPGWRATLAAALGGAGGIAGLATATVAGVWIGFAAPAPVAGVASGLGIGATAELVDLFPDDIAFIEQALNGAAEG